MTDRIKIAICGQMRAGKDTVADMFQEVTQGGFISLKFSEGITEVINRYFPDKVAEGKQRGLYQLIGQTFREIDEDVWVNRLAYEADCRFHFHDILVSDLRQPNEYDYCKKNGYIIIKVLAPKEIRLQRIAEEGDCFSPEMLQHETEQHIAEMPCDFLIVNNGSLLELEAKVEAIYTSITVGAAC